MSLPGGWELVLIVVVIVLLFGAKKLPDAARSIGRSMRIFKSEVKEMGNDDEQPQAQPQQGQIAPGQQDFWAQPQNQPGAQQNVQPNLNQQPQTHPQQLNPNQQNQ